MAIPDYEADAEYIQQDPEARQALMDAIKGNYPTKNRFPKMGRSKQRVLWWQLRHFAKVLDISLTDDRTAGREQVNEDLTKISRGFGKGRIPLYLAWLWAYHSDAAEAYYDQIGLEYSLYTGSVPELDLRGLPVKNNDEPVDESTLESRGAYSSWSRLVNAHAAFSRLEIVPIDDQNLSLIDFAEREPADEELHLGQDFCFRFDSPRAGDLIAFQRHRRVWYPLPLSPDVLHVQVAPGKQMLPVQPETGRPMPMSESDVPGNYGFAFLLAASGQLKELSHELQLGERLPLQLLPFAEKVIAALPPADRFIYRINAKITP